MGATISWEYRVFEYSPRRLPMKEIDVVLAEWGRDGWKLCAIERESAHDPAFEGPARCYFKRALAMTEPEQEREVSPYVLARDIVIPAGTEVTHDTDFGLDLAHIAFEMARTVGGTPILTEFTMNFGEARRLGLVEHAEPVKEVP